MNKTTKLTDSKDITMGFNSPMTREASTVAVDLIMITPFFFKSELVSRDYAPSNRATEKVQTIPVAPMKCNNHGSNSKGHEKHSVDCLETHIAICAQSGIREEIARKVTDSCIKGTKQNYHWMLEQ